MWRRLCSYNGQRCTVTTLLLLKLKSSWLLAQPGRLLLDLLDKPLTGFIFLGQGRQIGDRNYFRSGLIRFEYLRRRQGGSTWPPYCSLNRESRWQGSHQTCCRSLMVSWNACCKDGHDRTRLSGCKCLHVLWRLYGALRIDGYGTDSTTATAISQTILNLSKALLYDRLNYSLLRYCETKACLIRWLEPSLGMSAAMCIIVHCLDTVIRYFNNLIYIKWFKE